MERVPLSRVHQGDLVSSGVTLYGQLNVGITSHRTVYNIIVTITIACLFDLLLSYKHNFVALNIKTTIPKATRRRTEF